MWIDDDLIMPIDKKFGEIVKDREFNFPSDYPFYADGSDNGTELRNKFQAKFVRHFKYNFIAYDNIQEFTDHFEDIMYVNYPKYRHYWETLEKAKAMKWWNNKDFVTSFSRVLQSNNQRDFNGAINTADKLMQTLIRTGDVTSDYNKSFDKILDLKDINGGSNTVAKTGQNTSTKQIENTTNDAFTRNLISKTLGETDDTRTLELTDTTAMTLTKSYTNGSTKDNTGSVADVLDKQLVNTTTDKGSVVKDNTTKRTNQDNSASHTESHTDNNTDSLNKHLDTPQGSINNLIAEMNNYMTSGDSNTETEVTNSDTTTTNQSNGSSTDTTQGRDTTDKTLTERQEGQQTNTRTDKLKEVTSETIKGSDANSGTVKHTGTDKTHIGNNNTVTDTGTSSNTIRVAGQDETTDKFGETETTTLQTTLSKTGKETEEGHSKHIETKNTKDALNNTKEGEELTRSQRTDNGRDIETFTKTEEGNIGTTSAGHLVYEWLNKGYINIDRMILWDCEKLFQQIY